MADESAGYFLYEGIHIMRFRYALVFVTTIFLFKTAHSAPIGELEYHGNDITLNMGFDDKFTVIGVINNSNEDILINPADIKITTESGVFSPCTFHQPSVMMGGGSPLLDLVIKKGEKRLAYISDCLLNGNPFVINSKIIKIDVSNFHIYPSDSAKIDGGLFLPAMESSNNIIDHQGGIYWAASPVGYAARTFVCRGSWKDTRSAPYRTWRAQPPFNPAIISLLRKKCHGQQH